MSRATGGLVRSAVHSRRGLVTALLGIGLGHAGGALAGPPLAPLPGAVPCVTDDGTGGACADGTALAQSRAVAVSPDGRSVYVAAQGSDAIAVFDRHQGTGFLMQQAGTAACVSETGSGGLCADGKGLDGPADVAVSGDGRNVYVVSVVSDALTIFDRDRSTGTLTQKFQTAGCVSELGEFMVCANGRALDQAAGVAVSPDGRSVYVASAASDALAVFDRDPGTGAVTQKAGTAGCISQSGTGGECAVGSALDGAAAVVVSPDGRNVYVASIESDAVAVFERDLVSGALTQPAGSAGCVSETGSSGACADGNALDGAISLEVSPDGRNLYVVSSGSSAVAVFDRDLLTGALSQKAGVAGCMSDTGTGGECADGVSLGGALDLTVSGDGSGVYVTAADADAVAILDRDLATGALAQKGGTLGCISATGSAGACAAGFALGRPADVAASADGRSVYVASFDSGGVAELARGAAAYDVDGDGAIEALTDGLLLLRYFFGLRGAALVSGAVDLANCSRCTAAEIEELIDELLL